ncbi:MAG: LPS-assembly protein LptD [Nitrospirae bacterium]|nr:LPS-assembly protein LptD [Nitrospirota bacterium]
MMGQISKRPQRFFIFSILFLLGFFSTLFSPASINAEVTDLGKYAKTSEPITINADTLEYDREKDIYNAKGNVEIIQGKVRVTADEVTVDNKTGDVFASGNVVIIDGEDKLSCENLNLNMNTKIGVIHNGSMFIKKGNYHIDGNEFEKLSEDKYKIDKGSLTTCDAKIPDWRFRGSDIKITPNEYLTAWNVFFYVKDFPILYLPYIGLPIKTKRQTGFLIPRIGYSTKEGFKLKEAFFWAIADNMDATIYTDYRSKKGLGTALEFRYVLSPYSRGNLYTNYVNEWLTGREKWEGKYLIEHAFTERLNAKANINYVSDKSYYKDYSETTYERIQRSTDSNVWITQNWPSSSLYLWTQYTKDLTKVNDETVQRLPELGYKIVENRLYELPLFYSLNSTATNFERDIGKTGQRIDINPKLKTEINLFRAFVFSPRGELRETLYSESRETNESSHRFLYSIGAGLSTKVNRIYNIEGFGTIDRIRHSIEPEADYEYIPYVNQSQLPQFDAVDNIPKKNAVYYAITNRFSARYTKGAEIKKLEFLMLKLSQSYDINEEIRYYNLSTPKRPFSDIRAELNIKSEQMINLFIDTKYNPYTGHLTELNSDLRFQIGRFWYLTAGERYTKNPRIEFLTGGTGLSLPFGLDISGMLWYDLQLERMREQTYTLKYARQCWSAGLVYNHRPDRQQILFTVELRGIGAVKLH